jgi:hypothetical protein
MKTRTHFEIEYQDRAGKWHLVPANALGVTFRSLEAAVKHCRKHYDDPVCSPLRIRKVTMRVGTVRTFKQGHFNEQH